MEKVKNVYVLQDEALELAVEYDKIFMGSVKEQRDLEKEFNVKYQKIYDDTNASLRDLWRRMAAMSGLDPDASWGQPNIALERKYLSNGFAALVEIDIPKGHPLAGALPPTVKDEVAPTDKLKLN